MGPLWDAEKSFLGCMCILLLWSRLSRLVGMKVVDFGLPLQGSCAKSLLLQQPKSLVLPFVFGALFPWHTTVGKYWPYKLKSKGCCMSCGGWEWGEEKVLWACLDCSPCASPWDCHPAKPCQHHPPWMGTLCTWTLQHLWRQAEGCYGSSAAILCNTMADWDKQSFGSSCVSHCAHV